MYIERFRKLTSRPTAKLVEQALGSAFTSLPSAQAMHFGIMVDKAVQHARGVMKSATTFKKCSPGVTLVCQALMDSKSPKSETGKHIVFC